MKPTERKQRILETLFQDRKLLIQYIVWSMFYIAFDAVVRSLITQKFQIWLVFWDCYQTVVMYGVNVLWFLSTLLIVRALARTFETENLRSVRYFAGGGGTL